jgi:putative transposase
LSEKRDKAAAEAFFRSARTVTNSVPERVTTDGHDAYPGTIKAALGKKVRHRTNRYLNNHLEQDHRAVKRLMHPMLGFKSFWAARCTIAGIETMHAIRKGQLLTAGNESQTPAEQFYALAA